MKPYIIGISGASGSGKSTFSQKLTECLPGSYYLPIDKHYKKVLPTITSPMDGKEYPDWNQPDSIDRESAKREILNAASSDYPYIIVDGAFIFCIPEIDDLFDFKIYIDATIEMRIYRRIRRNLVTKNQTLEEIADYYLKCARYREKEYSLPSGETADLRIDNENGFSVSPESTAKIIMEKNIGILETERLVLRKMSQSDFGSLCRILQDDEVMYAYEGAFSDEEVQSWLDKQLKRYSDDGFGLYAVILKETGEMIGQCGLTIQEFKDKKVLEVGYLFQKAFWHKGYAAEAAIACKQYAFDVLKAQEVYSIIRDNNTASQNVAKRNGMTIVDSFVKQYRGFDMPHLVFSVKRSACSE